MSNRNRVGLLTFESQITSRLPIAPLPTSRFDLANAIASVKVGGGTALYDAIRAGIEMTDAATAEPDTIRAVVVLTDGQANGGTTHLDRIIQMASRAERPIVQYRGFENDKSAVEEGGRAVDRTEINGTGVAIRTRNPVLIFFVGIGDADLEVGRLFAEATGATFHGATEKDFAGVIAQFGKYF
jgi:hypothetical protein